MSMNFHGSAKIYQFPRKPLPAGERRRDGNPSVAELSAPSLPAVDFGSGWYHEAAVKDADRSRKL